MKKVNAYIALIFSSISVMAQAPTDNPMAVHYESSRTYPAWTEEINWANVITMENKGSGTDNFTEFQSKRDILYAQGGGVLYYPAGTYTFDIPDSPNGEGLLLKKGVVIRGATPATNRTAVTVKSKTAAATDHGLTSMPTKFVFTTTNLSGALNGQIPKAWNMVGIKKGNFENSLAQVSHCGIAWVEMEYAYIYFGLDNASGWGPTWGTSKGWLSNSATNGWENRIPDGTHPMDPFHGTSIAFGTDTGAHGQKFFVFGVHIKNAAIPNYMSDRAKTTGWKADIESWRFTGKITLEGAHIFIANNVISKPTIAFPVIWTCKGGGPSLAAGTVVNTYFNYGYGVGIDVNKGLGSAFGNRAYMDNTVEGLYFAEDVMIQDNFIYNHGNKSIEAAGKYLVIRGNVLSRDFLSWKTNPYGLTGVNDAGVNTSNGRCHKGESPDDMMSRTMDLGGWMTWVDDNYGKNTGTDFANDGEGILYQRHNGIEVYGVAITNNHLLEGYIAPYDVHAVGLLHAWNNQPGSLGIIKQVDNWIEDVAAPGELNVPAKTTSPNNGLRVQDYMAECGNDVSAIDSAINVSVIWDAVHDGVKISWNDNSSNEIGFRIEKRKTGTLDWIIVAYRPRQETSSTSTMDEISKSFGYPTPLSLSFPSTMKIDDLNPTIWYDYFGDPNNAFEYRVVAIDCENNDAAAAPGQVTGIRRSPAVTTVSYSVFPNPSSAKLNIEGKYGSEISTISISDLSGKQVLNKSYDTVQMAQLDISTLKPGIYRAC